nr:hypothetical protein [Paraburkholderia dinghuensis]
MRLIDGAKREVTIGKEMKRRRDQVCRRDRDDVVQSDQRIRDPHHEKIDPGRNCSNNAEFRKREKMS